MSAFELFFSLFGLILGLAVAVIITGLADIFRERAPVKIGWLTPLLAMFVLDDLTTMWVNSYYELGNMDVAYGPFLAALLVAGSYFFAASMVFPKTIEDWPSLDDYYLSRVRLVIGGVLAANLGAKAIAAMLAHNPLIFITNFVHTWMGYVWWVGLLALLVTRRPAVHLAVLVTLLASDLLTLFIYW